MYVSGKMPTYPSLNLTKEIEPAINFYPWLVLIGFRTTQPMCINGYLEFTAGGNPAIN